MMTKTPTPKDAKRLFDFGFDTVEIARLLRLTEAEATRLLMIAREISRDPVEIVAPALGQSSVAILRSGRPSIDRVQDMDSGCAVGDPGAGEEQEDRGAVQGDLDGTSP